MCGDDICYKTTLQNFSLLIKVIQSSGKLPPVGSYTERLVTQMINRVVGVQALSVTIVNEKEVFVEKG